MAPHAERPDARIGQREDVFVVGVVAHVKRVPDAEALHQRAHRVSLVGKAGNQQVHDAFSGQDARPGIESRHGPEDGAAGLGRARAVTVVDGQGKILTLDPYAR